jgi:hypothetical protein
MVTHLGDGSNRSYGGDSLFFFKGMKQFSL